MNSSIIKKYKGIINHKINISNKFVSTNNNNDSNINN